MCNSRTVQRYIKISIKYWVFRSYSTFYIFNNFRLWNVNIICIYLDRRCNFNVVWFNIVKRIVWAFFITNICQDISYEVFWLFVCNHITICFNSRNVKSVTNQSNFIKYFLIDILIHIIWPTINLFCNERRVRITN